MSRFSHFSIATTLLGAFVLRESVFCAKLSADRKLRRKKKSWIWLRSMIRGVVLDDLLSLSNGNIAATY